MAVPDPDDRIDVGGCDNGGRCQWGFGRRDLRNAHSGRAGRGGGVKPQDGATQTNTSTSSPSDLSLVQSVGGIVFELANSDGTVTGQSGPPGAGWTAASGNAASYKITSSPITVNSVGTWTGTWTLWVDMLLGYKQAAAAQFSSEDFPTASLVLAMAARANQPAYGGILRPDDRGLQDHSRDSPVAPVSGTVTQTPPRRRGIGR